MQSDLPSLGDFHLLCQDWAADGIAGSGEAVNLQACPILLSADTTPSQQHHNTLPASSAHLPTTPTPLKTPYGSIAIRRRTYTHLGGAGIPHC